MATRLVLLCAAATPAMRIGAFPDPADPLAEGGRAKARALRLDGVAGHDAVASPAAAARETAALTGLDATVEAALADLDHGAWTGRGLDAIAPADLARWIAAPERGAPGGESMAALVARIAPWLDGLAGGGRRVLAVTHAAVVRAVLAHALALPVAAALAIDVPPLALVRLSFVDRWRLRLG